MTTQTKPTLIALILALSLFLPFTFAQDSTEVESEDKEAALPVVQIAILLDTSGSMQGLISQAKTQLWKIVNEFVAAKQNGKTPIVQVALYEYGSRSSGDDGDFIHQLMPLTRDLDTISEKLFELTTSGSSEYCGAVIQKATIDLKWDDSNDTYKAIFIAGNEPFTQGPVEPMAACRKAIAKGVVVNTIHCGADKEGKDGGWEAAADAADGKYLVINHNRAITSIKTPHDAELLKLNEALNETYVYYGRKGLAGKVKQEAQDKNALAAAPAAVQSRIVTKASVNYSNVSWDLVDASKQKDFDITKIKEADLPEDLKKLTVAERKAHVEKMAAQRSEIQAKIREASKKRAAFIAEKAKESGEDDTLGAAVSKVVREQAGKKKISWGQ